MFARYRDGCIACKDGVSLLRMMNNRDRKVARLSCNKHEGRILDQEVDLIFLAHKHRIRRFCLAYQDLSIFPNSLTQAILSLSKYTDIVIGMKIQLPHLMHLNTNDLFSSRLRLFSHPHSPHFTWIDVADNGSIAFRP